MLYSFVLCLLLRFSAQALSAVFTSDKLLLTVLINVLHPNVEKVVGVDSHCTDTVETSDSCSSTSKQYFSKAVKKLWRQKSATMPAKQNCVSCESRRLSEPLIRCPEQTQLSRTLPDTNSCQSDKTHNCTSAVIEHSRLEGTFSKPFSSRSNAVWLSSGVSSEVCAATTACNKEPLVVNPVYGSDDCSTLKSLSFEKKNSCVHDHTSAVNQVLCMPENTINGSVSDQTTSSSSAQEERRHSTFSVTPALSDFATDENVTFPQVPASDHSLSTSCCGYTEDVSRPVNEADDETRDICCRFAYRKVCVYLQEGTWRHSPHSLHCIRIDGDISLVVLCEVMLSSLLCTASCYFA